MSMKWGGFGTRARHARDAGVARITILWKTLRSREWYERSQFSVYARFVNGKEAFQTRVNRIERNLPSMGDIQILNFTDRQYRDIVHFSDQGRRAARRNPEQLVMF